MSFITFSLPPELANLVHLRILSVSHNQLVTLPETLFHKPMNFLTTLDFSNNKLQSFPSVATLCALTKLDIHSQCLCLHDTSYRKQAVETAK